MRAGPLCAWHTTYSMPRTGQHTQEMPRNYLLHGQSHMSFFFSLLWQRQLRDSFPSKCWVTGERKGVTDRDTDCKVSVCVQASDSTACMCQSDTLAWILDRMKNPAPKLRRAADGWEKISKTSAARNLDIWVFLGCCFQERGGHLLLGMHPEVSRVPSVVLFGITFLLYLMFWDLGSRFQGAIKSKWKMGALYNM